MTRRWLSILIVCLVATNIITATFLVRYIWRNWTWELQMSGQAGYGATLKAISDFRSGELRIYRVVPDGRIEFTGQMDGEFEVWNWPSYAEGGYPFKYTAEQFVRAYNSRMRNMVAHPERFENDYEARRKLSGLEAGADLLPQLAPDTQ
jgi:hypothetical protein